MIIDWNWWGEDSYPSETMQWIAGQPNAFYITRDKVIIGPRTRKWWNVQYESFIVAEFLCECSFTKKDAEISIMLCEARYSKRNET